MKVVGVGALDNASGARDFLRATGVTAYPLLWAEDAAAWAPFGVSSQPYALLLRNGEVVERWPGGTSPEEIRAAVDRTS